MRSVWSRKLHVSLHQVIKLGVHVIFALVRTFFTEGYLERPNVGEYKSGWCFHVTFFWLEIFGKSLKRIHWEDPSEEVLTIVYGNKENSMPL